MRSYYYCLLIAVVGLSAQSAIAQTCTGSMLVTIQGSSSNSALGSSLGTVTNVTCNGGNNGSVVVNATGGTAPYTYSWQLLPAGTVSTFTGTSPYTITNLVAGNYSISVTDANACVIPALTTTITQPTLLVPSATQTNVLCFGNNTGAINLSVAGGVAPYTFNWGGGITTEDRTNLVAGTYTVTVTDANSCTAVLSRTITQPAAALALSSTQTNVLCFGNNTGAIDLSVTGGVAPYTYNWGGGITSQDRTNLVAGTYTVIVTDANGCTANLSVTITQPAAALTLSETHVNVACFGGNTGSINVTTSGGTAPYTYNWGAGVTTEDRTNLIAGNYSLTTTDANFCTAVINVTITQPAAALALSSTQTNVACFGNNTGAINLTATGGTSPYTFNWGGGITSEDRTNLTAGTYTVITTDANGCTANLSVTITQPAAALALSSTQTNVLCFGNNTGAINLTATGGTSPYTFNWGGGITTEDRTNLTAGTYTVISTDANGCTANLSVTITQPAAALALSETHVNVGCFGASTGSIDVSVTGGTAPYTYNWGSGITTQDRSNLVTGSYSLTCADANGCTVAINVIITQPAAALALSSTQTNVLCFGNNTGAINLTATGGTSPYTFNWGGGITSEDRTNLAAGTYTVIATDANGCTANLSVTITQPAAALALTETHVDVACFGANTGSINLSVNGGTAPYTYAWSNSATTQDLSNLVTGTYTVTTTDANGCSAQLTVIITQPAASLALSSTQTNVACFGNNTGAINLTVTGGTTPYTFNWGGVATEDRSNLTAGTYTVIVTDANSCTANLSATITQPAAALTLSSTQTNVLCFGNSTGAINLTATGGTAPYTYNWGGGITSEDRTNLVAGTYNVISTDANGCTANLSVTITQPAAALVLTETHVDIACFGANTGSINLNVNGGTAPYTYAWSNGTTTQDLSNLVAGTYTVTTTDANSCSSQLIIVITQPAAALAINETHTNVTCNGAANGTINITVTGGTTPYTYNWGAGVTIEDRTGLSPGTYAPTATDANGCTVSTTITITQPAVLVATATAATPYNGQNISCNGTADGSATVAVSGGTTAYTYNWNTVPVQTTATATGLSAGTYRVTITDANSCTASAQVSLTNPAVLAASTTAVNYNGFNISCRNGNNGQATVAPTGGVAPYTYAWNTSPTQTTPVATGLIAGTYGITVTDVNGCTVSNTITLTQPTQIALASTTSNNNGFGVTCNGACNGSMTANPAGGVTPYTYVWNTVPVQTTATATGLCAGTYNVTMTDANGCSASAQNTITAPQPVTASASVTTQITGFGLCNGSATASAGGGVAPYTYLWNVLPTQATPTATGLCAGTYRVTITDANGCTATAETTVGQPNQLTCSVIVSSNYNGQNISCNGASDGQASVTANGGVAAYTYNWNTVPAQTNATATGLAAGNYNVTVTDANGNTTTCAISLASPTLITTSFTVLDTVSCNGQADGRARVNVSGGTPTYTYLWPASANNQTTAIATGLAAGTYNVTVTDLNACSTVRTVTMPQPAVLTIVSTAATPYNGQSISCNGLSNATINTVSAGGTQTYDYAWSNGATTATLTNVPAGTYTVTLTDYHGCTATATTTITQPTPVAATVAVSSNFNGQNVSCFGATDGQATVTASGGVTPYAYLWSNGQTNAVAPALGAGNYLVTITDVNGCSVTRNVTLVNPTQLAINPVVSNFNGSSVSCNGSTNASITSNPSGGTTPYAFVWTPAASTQDLTNIGAGTYNVTLTDANGCSVSATRTVTQPAVLVASATAGTTHNGLNISCNGAADGSATAAATGGTAPYTYAWSNGQTNALATGLVAGTYIVTITDANGCTATAQTTLVNPPALTFTTTLSNFNGFNVSCPGANNGSATANPVGGLTPYTYAWNSTPFQVMQTAIQLTAGTYGVTVTDRNGCTVSGSVTMTQPTPLATSLAVSSNNGFGVSCNGSCNATITNNTTGGVTPYTYTWSANTAGQTAQTAVNLCAGNYNVTVVDANGCTTTQTTSISQPTVLVTSATVSSLITGAGLCNGAVTNTPSGGVAPYTYAWSANAGGQTIQTPTGLCAGSYIVTVTDANGCTATAQVTLGQPGQLVCSVAVSSSYNGQNISCNGAANGQATVTATGGVGGFTYIWSTSPAQTTSTATGLVAGTYTVTTTDTNGNTTSCGITLAQPNALTATFAVVDTVACNGQANGVASVSATGGTTPYAYLWPSSAANQFTPTATGLAAGNYNVSITDVNGCSVIVTVVMPQPAVLTASAVANQPLTYNGQNISCNGSADGSITLTTTGGTQTYDYLWSNGFTGSNPSNLAAGTYNVTITDFHNCTTTTSVTITQPTPVAGTVAVTSNFNGRDVSCVGSTDGAATASPSGGVAPYTFTWSNGQTSATATGLAAGTYTVTITDANGCFTTRVITLNNPPALVLTNTPVLNNGFAVSCNGGVNGAINTTTSGGTTPYTTYLWSNSATTANINNLAVGIYTATVTDVNGCTATTSATLSAPTTVQVSASVTSSYNGAQLSCNGVSDASISTSANGGVGTYTYLWSNGATTANLTNVGAGTYTVTTTDANGCTATAQTSVTAPVALVASAAASSNFNGFNVACNGSSNGTATVTTTGGTGSVTYLWSNGQTTAMATGLVAGTYTVTTTDANGCTSTAQAVITQPATVVATTTIVNDYCQVAGGSGSITVQVTNGVAPYQVAWSGVESGNPAGNEIATSGASFLISNLTFGAYTVTVTDANGCVQTVPVTILGASSGQPLDITSVEIFNANCALSDGKVTLTVNGGSTPYTYTWSPNVSSTQQALNIPAGIYNVSVTDAFGCIATTTASVQTNTGGPVVSTAVTATTCAAADGTITVSTTPAQTVNIIYALGSGANTTLTNVTTPYTITGLAVGTYNITVITQAGCSSSTSATVPTGAGNLTTLTFPSNTTSCTACDGSIQVAVANATAPITYTLLAANGTTLQTLTVNSLVPNTFNGLCPGTYSIRVQDANGCLYNSAAIIINSGSGQLTAAMFDLTAVTCPGGNNGGITANASAPAGLTYAVYENGNFVANLPATSLTGGSYTVVGTDGGGCVLTSPVLVITQPSEFVVNITQTAETCAGNDGGLSLTVSGATAPYTFAWSNGSTTNSAAGLVAGTLYSVTITDAAGCTHIVNNMQVLNGCICNLNIASYVAINSHCDNTGELILTTQGGVAPISFLWNVGLATANATGLPAGYYCVTVTDANGCTATGCYSILDVGGPQVNVINTTPAVCTGSQGTITINVNAAVSPSRVEWGTGFANNVANGNYTITGLAAGTYDITVRENNGTGCSTLLSSVTVGATSGSLSIASANVTNTTCGGACVGSVTLALGGGTASPYTYVILAANGTQVGASQTQASISTVSFGSLCVGNYTAQVTDGNGCVATRSFSIGSGSVTLNASEFTITDISCPGGNNGSIVFSAVPAAGRQYSLLNVATGITSGIPATNLVAGQYIVTVTEAGCSTSLPLNLVEPAEWVINFSTTSQTCSTLGAISSTIVGATAPYAYDWSNGATTQNISNLVGGNGTSYNFTVTDSRGCVQSAIVPLNNNCSCTIAIDHIIAIQPNCGLNNGSIDIEVASVNTSAPVVYSWNPPAGNTNILTSLLAGTYNVTITNGPNCEVTATIPLTNADGPSVTTTVTDATCTAANGAVSIQVTSGVAPYTVTVNGLATTGINPFVRGNLAAGTYTVEVTDANGCVRLTQVTIGSTAGNLAYTNTVQNATCGGNADGSITVNVTGGSLPFTYYLNGIQQSNNTFTGLSAGVYDVEVRDGNGCILATQATINEGSFSIAGSYQFQPTLCPDTDNGAFVPAAVGVTFRLYNSAGTLIPATQWTALPQGNYTVIGTQSGTGCVAQGSGTVNGPANWNVQFAIADETCVRNNGSIQVFVSGATAPYTYAWANGATTSTIDSLAAGSYPVTITDANGCSVVRTLTVEDRCECQLQALSLFFTQPTCGASNGSITASFTDSPYLPPYTFTWSNNGPTVIITSGTSNTLNNISAGVYTVTITNGAGCSVTPQFSAEVESIGGPVAVVASTTSALCTAANGSVTVSVTNGVAPYTVSTSGNIGTVSGLTVSGLAAGSVGLLITDANGCVDILNANIPQSSGSFGYNLTGTNPNCGVNDGSVTLALTGGAGIFNYNLVGPTTASVSTFNSPYTFTNLAQGTYSVVGTDANGCTTSRSITLNSTGGPSINMSNFNISDVTCPGGTNGNVTVVNGSGAVATDYYVYTTDGINLGHLPVNNLAPGNYLLAAFAGACRTEVPFTINDRPEWVVGIGAANPSCTAGQGFIDLIVSGATPGYTYRWNYLNDTTEDLTNIYPGNYQVTITDANLCTAVTNVILTPCNADTTVIIIANTTDTICIDLTDIAYNATSNTVTIGSCTSVNLATSYGLTGTNCLVYTAQDLVQGIDEVCIVNCDDQGFCDTTYIHINVVYPNCDLGLPDSLFGQIHDLNCQDSASFCFPIPFDLIDDYIIEYNTNGGTYVPYTGSFLGCDYGTSAIYNFATSPICPDSVFAVQWTFNNIIYRDTIGGGISGVAQLLQGWNPTGSWNYDASSMSIFGGDAATVGQFGLLSVTCLATSVNSTDVPRIDIVPQGTQLSFGAGVHSVVFTNAYGCSDTTTVTVYCVTPETIIDTILAGTTDTSCFDLSQLNLLPGQTPTVTNLCPTAGNGNVNFNVIYGANGEICIAYFGENPGDGQACIEICATNAQGYTICDTTYVQVHVDCNLVTPDSVGGEIHDVPCADSLSFCFPIPYNEIDSFVIQYNTDGGAFVTYNGPYTGCDFNTAAIYNFATTPSCPSSNWIVNWTYAGQAYGPDTIAANLQSVAQLLASWNPNGGWAYDANTASIYGGDVAGIQGNLFGALSLFCESTLDLSTDMPRIDYVPRGTELTFGVGVHEVVFTSPYGCSDTSVVTVVCDPLVAVDDYETLQYFDLDNTISFNICDNDLGTPIDSVYYLTSPVLGGLDVNNDPCEVTYSYNGDECGTSPIDSFQYVITIGEYADTATVFITIECDEFQVYNGFSPNGDGFNDFFTIDGITDFPKADLVIYNRWGNLVFEAVGGYNNNWGGTFNGGDLPDGTYFYVLKLNDELRRVYNGYIEIRR